MPSRAQAATAGARSTVFAVCAVGLALGAHVTAGGTTPALPVLVLLGALVEVAAGKIARRPRGPLPTAAALGAAQAGLHIAFTVAGPAHTGTGAHPTTGSMLAWHAAATLLLAAVLSRGERVLAHLVGLLLPVVALGPFRTRPARTPSAVPPARDAPRAHRQVRGHAVSRRGPPPAPLAAA